MEKRRLSQLVKAMLASDFDRTFYVDGVIPKEKYTGSPQVAGTWEPVCHSYRTGRKNPERKTG